MKKSLLILAGALSSAGFSQMTMHNNASMLAGSGCNCYQVTPNLSNKKGAIWSPAPIDLTNAFDMTFYVYLGTNDGGADGLAFVLQQNGTGIGDFGYTLGYHDIAPANTPAISASSFAIEIDTWNSSPTVATDIASDHIGISSNGSNEHNLGGPYPIANIEDGNYHTFRVIWNPGLTTIAALLDGAPIFASTINITNLIFSGNPMVYFGFTASGGGAFNEQRVCMYRNAGFTQDLTSLCPGSTVNFTDNSTSDLNNIVDYTWNYGDGSPLDVTQNGSHTYTVPGTYTAKLYMTDISGCDDSAEVLITVLPDLIIDVVGQNPTCFGDTDGEATATSQNGTGPYTYTWDDPLVQTTQTATGLLANTTYNVDVVDDLGCTGSGTVTIGETAEIIVDIIRDDASCFGSSDGQVEAVVTNGVGPFTFTWDDPSAQTTNPAAGLPAGTYSVTVTDANGCTATASTVVNQPAEIFITGVVSYDNGTSNGAIDATATGGTPTYTFAWSNSETTEDITGLGAGDYTLTVTDANGCTKDTTFSVKSSVGIGEESKNPFEIFPNPSTGTFQVKGVNAYLISISDASGKLVYSSNANGLQKH
ncbi:MAG: PKD domain-containing protein [Crocinitomicaceae bacterium]|nr:PKD domain-containing protein [Crocinitomicaceae bacterium]